MSGLNPGNGLYFVKSVDLTPIFKGVAPENIDFDL
jgi:hypothetical protein